MTKHREISFSKKITNSILQRYTRLSLLLLLPFLSIIAYAGFTSNTELKIQTALIYKITKFVKWPSQTIETDNKFSICLIGSDYFGSIFDVLSNRKVNNIPINIRRIKHSDPINNDCKIAYISVATKQQLQSITKQLQFRPILTISTHAQFVDLGGIVQFIIKNDRMRFNINIINAENAGLTIAAPLLELANEVKTVNKQ